MDIKEFRHLIVEASEDSPLHRVTIRKHQGTWLYAVVETGGLTQEQADRFIQRLQDTELVDVGIVRFERVRQPKTAAVGIIYRYIIAVSELPLILG